jgi:hypothetical protein
MKKLYSFIFAAVLLQGCSLSKDDNSGVTTGEGGSLARFAIVGDYLYTVDETSLNVYSLVDNNSQMQFLGKTNLGFGAETIFPYGNALLLGTQDGMYIYDISIPASPHKLTLFQHIRSCDPVVAENNYAYITLNASNTQCWRGLNEMQIVDIHDLSAPYLKTTYNLTSPRGIDIHNDTLYVCDDGLRILDVSDKNTPFEIAHFYDVSAEDVIYTQGRLLTTGPGGFTQYTINSSGISKLSTIPVAP